MCIIHIELALLYHDVGLRKCFPSSMDASSGDRGFTVFRRFSCSGAVASIRLYGDNRDQVMVQPSSCRSSVSITCWT